MAQAQQNPILRPGMPPLPEQMKRLPIDRRGYPIPYFVEWIEGEPNFPVMSNVKRAKAQRLGLCWVCGGKLGIWHTYVLGPMCTISRTTMEPANHLACAEFSVKACPFLARPGMHRNKAALPDNVQVCGLMIERNPGVSALWTQRGQAKAFRVPDGRGGAGWLLTVGDPDKVTWWREGRPATRAEVEEAIETGLPALRNVEVSAEAHAELARYEERARQYLPDAA